MLISCYDSKIQQRLNDLIAQDPRVNEIRNELLNTDIEIQALKAEQSARLKHRDMIANAISQENEQLKELTDSHCRYASINLEVIMSKLNGKKLNNGGITYEMWYRLNGFRFILFERSCGEIPAPYSPPTPIRADTIHVGGIFNQSLIETLSVFDIDVIERYHRLYAEVLYPCRDNQDLSAWESANEKLRILSLIISREQEPAEFQGLDDQAWMERL